MTTCATCKWYFEVAPAKDDFPGGGQCRVRAPSVGFVPMLNNIERGTSFPSVQADVWCGEYKPKPRRRA